MKLDYIKLLTSEKTKDNGGKSTEALFCQLLDAITPDASSLPPPAELGFVSRSFFAGVYLKYKTYAIKDILDFDLSSATW